MHSALTKLNIIQFIDAVSENFYRMLIAYFLIDVFGAPYTSRALAETGALFLIPFLIFSTPGGVLGDKFSKRSMITVTRIAQLITLILTFFAIAKASYQSCMILLFLFSSFSALFAPSKYGILPEIYPKQKLIFANSILAALTYLGIILGIGLSSAFLQLGEKQFFSGIAFLILLSLISIVFCFSLPKVAAQNPRKKVSLFPYAELFISMVEMRRLPKLYPAVKANAYFLFLGTFVQLNVVAFAVSNLNLEPLYGGYLFLVTALGIGIGALIINKLMPVYINLAVIPYAGFGISICLTLLAFFSFNWALALLWLFLIGILAGLFLVPSQTYILAISPNETRSRNYSTANFLSFFYALFAPLTLFVLNSEWNIWPSISFFLVAIFNALIMLGFLKTFQTGPKTPL